jgi:hypothetical protein
MAQVCPLHVQGQDPRSQSAWLEELIISVSKKQCSYILLTTWRAWYARNEVTHDMPLPAIEGSRRFLCSYAHMLDNIRKLSTEDIVKGKQPMHPWHAGACC